MMSDTDKPAVPATSPGEQPAPQPAAQGQPPAQPAPDQPAAGPTLPPEPERVKPPRERPGRTGAPVPSLQHEQSYGFGKRIDAFDEELERELQEAMGGFSDKDLYGEPAARGGRGKAEAQAG